MTDPRPAPYPADTLAKGWRFELHMEKVKRSDTWLRAKTGRVRGALMLLWGEAWEQTPCGSLPADDELVALLIDMAPAEFEKTKAVLMRGWWLADDGRLYHDTITERVLAMLVKRAKDAKRTADRRGRLAGLDAGPPDDAGVSRVTHPGLAHDSTVSSTPSTKHQAPSTGEKTEKPARKRAAAPQLVSVEALVAEGVDPQHAADWLVARKTKDLPLTPTAWADTKAEAEKAGMTVPEAIKTAAGNGWAGFKAKWLTAEAGAHGQRQHVNKQVALEQSNKSVAAEWAHEGST